MRLSWQVISLVTLFLCHASAQRTENVVIAVIDGARYTETFGDEQHANVSRMWNELRPQGTLFTNFRNEGETSTSPGHASILTGTWQYIPNDGSQRPGEPTVFEYLRKVRGSSQSENQVVLGKSKLSILTHGIHPEYGSPYSASVRTAADSYSDDQAWGNLKDVLAREHPILTIVNFPETDKRGHDGNWNGYLSAIRTCDERMCELWDMIEQDAAYAGRTMLIITDDHGRHSDGSGSWTEHGPDCHCEGCSHVMMLVLAPEFAAGVIDTTRRTLIDIAPTIGALLGFETPYAEGTALPFDVPTVARAPLAVSATSGFTHDVRADVYGGGVVFSIAGFTGAFTISIYAFDGSRVRLRGCSSQVADAQVLAWDGTLRNGAAAPAGRYLYRVESGGRANVCGLFSLVQ